MAKTLLTVSVECLTANKSKNGSHIIFANNVQQTDKGPASRESVTVVVPDSKTASLFDPTKKYTVTITEG